MKQIQTVIAISILMICVACKKDNKENRMDLISSGNWKMIAFTVNPGYDYDVDGDIDTDIFAVTDNCEKDNLYLFKTNGALELNEGTLKCDVGDPQVYSTDWEFSNNERDILIAGDAYHIEEISSTRLKISQDDGGYKSVITFSK